MLLVMRSTKIFLLTAFCAGIIQLGYSQRGKEGDATIATTNNIVNTYTYLTADAGPGIGGGLSITVNDAAMTGGAFGAPLAAGDLIMIIQMQGANMNNDGVFAGPNPGQYSVPNCFTWFNNWFDHAEVWGSIGAAACGTWGAYNNSGKYEQIEVLSAAGSTIQLQCALENNYTASGHVQVVRVPRYNNLTLTATGNAIVPSLWNGQTGGVVAIEVDQVLDLNAGATISASATGFRGGQVDAVGQTGSWMNTTGVTFLGAGNPIEGSEKGESIYGFYTEYDAIFSRYGISAATNGGGGAGFQNAGGGGGSNIYTGGLRYTGTGTPDQGPGGAYTPAWNLDISFPPDPNPDVLNPGTPHLLMTPIGTNVSPGGGRGGYSLADDPTPPNPLTVGPRNAAWLGDARKSNGGLGGHPLVYDPTRIFFGGGGGAGDQDSGQGGSGGRGGGLVYITNYGSITGSGSIEANGADGGSSGPFQGNDGAGGGGAGGWIHIENATAIPASIQLNAVGGDGGDMVHTTFGFGIDEASGPGGSGTGGAIAYNSGAPTENVSAGANGVVTTDHPTQMMANFPPNGATNGSAGVSGLAAPFYDLVATNASICGGNTANLSVAVQGSLPSGGTVTWYDQQFGGSSVNTGLTYTTPVLAATTTYWVGVCPNGGQFRVPVTVTVNTLDDASFSYASNTYCSSDPDPTPTITGLAGGSFSGPAGLVINATTGEIDLSASTVGGPYTITYTTVGPCPNSSTFDVSITALDDASFSYASASYCTSESDPTPTITGETGGTFSAPAGLSINASTGVIDLSASTVGGPYTVTYTTTAPCANSATFDVTINALDDASFTYASGSYCTSEVDPTPTITGEPGGTFTAPAGLSINASTGVIDLSASTPGGPYAVTYTTNAPCANSATFDVTITALDDASFTYAAASYCTSDADPTPTITGEPGGTFTAPAGLSINASTGVIDVSASTIGGPYTVTYTTNAPCANSATFDVTITGLDDASFSYSATSYCTNDSDPTPTITGEPGGTFTAPAGLSINASTGVIDVSASTVGGPYTVTYTTNAPCTNSATFDVTINAVDDASFSYSAAAYCANEVDPAAIITGTAGGAFTSAPGGLVINAGTGLIDLSASTPGSYTVTYTTAGVCPASSNVAVTVNAVEDASFTLTATCVGGTATITGTTGGTFAFNPAPGDGATINPTTGAVTNGTLGNTYFVEYTTGGACSASSIQSVTAATDLAYNATLTDENCGAGDGSIVLTASGGDGGPYQYSITGGAPYSNPGNFTGLSANTYNISVLDNSGCEVTGTESLSSTGGPSIDNVAVTDPTCAGDCDGSITITVSGGTPPYSYQWFDAGMNPIGTDSPTLSGQCAGSYSVEVTDAGGGGGTFWLEDFGTDAGCANQNQLATTAIPVNGAWTQTITAGEGAVPNQWFISATEAFTGTGNCGDGCLGNPALTNQTLHVGSLGVGLCPTGDCGAAYNAGGNGETHKRIESPVIDCSGQTGITLTFEYMHFGETGTDAASLLYYDGATWTGLAVPLPQGACCGGPCGGLLTQGQWSPVPYSITLPASANNNPNVQIGFSWDNNANNSGADPSFAVDDITLSVTSGGGCPAFANATLTDPAAPTIMGNTPICVNGTVTLTGSGTPDPTTPWSSSAPGVATITSGGLVTGISAGTSTITYTDDNGCQITEVVTVNALDDASFSYGASSYCQSDPDPTPTITGLAGGTFSAPAGLSINASTGVIDVSASTIGGPYTVTYTTSGACPNSATFDVSITALDDASFNYSAASYCVNDADPTPTITGVAGGTFASAPGGLSINASTGAIDVSASTPGAYTVTYTTSGTCANSSNVAVTINALDDATFNYSAAAYCSNDVDPTPTITGLAGGTFSSTAGLSINTTTGEIDVSASTPNTYTVTYTTNGACPNSSNVSVTVNALDDATFTYGSNSYCQGDPDPTPTITGLAGGTFSAPAGLSINASTGVIDVSASTIGGPYTVTYTTNGACPNLATFDVSITALDDASFNYSAAAYCVNDVDQTPTITGVAGGTFTSAPGGLSINASTGVINVSGSTPGTYTVTYTTTGTCSNSSNVSVTINALDDASFNYSAAAYCVNDVDQTPTITGLAGGTFTSAPAGLSINATTGIINVSGSTPGTYTVTYTTVGTCSNSSDVSVTINALEDASFSYAAALYCADASDPSPTITGVSGGTFTSAPAGLSIDASTGVIDLSTSTAGTYTVTYTTAGACANSSDVMVEVVANPTLTITNPAAVCTPGTADLTDPAVTAGSDPGTLTYWQDALATMSVVTPGAVGAGTYYIQLENLNGCTTIQPVTVSVNALPNVTASNNGPVCSGTSLLLDETGGDAVAWSWSTSGGAAIITNTDQSPTVNSAVDGEVFTVVVTDANGCTNSATTTVSIIPQPMIDPIADVTVCDAYYLPAITGINLTGGESFYDDSQANGGTALSVGDAISSSQTIYIFDGNGTCSNEISFVVTVNPTPTVTSISGGAEYCVGDPIADIEVEVTGTPNWTINYTLDGVAQSATGGASPVSLGNAPGVYLLLDVSDANCAGVASGMDSIIVHPYPLEPLAGTDETYCTTSVFNDMTASGSGGTLTWYSDAGLTDVLTTGPTLTPSNTEGITTYYVTETANGCEGPASMVVITVEDCEVIIPTAFTPDGDLVNDMWEILYLDTNYPENIVRVYNRWGSLIFEHEANASNPYSSNMWDGTYQGQPLPVGSYYFVIDFNDGGAEPQKGTVSIILND